MDPAAELLSRLFGEDDPAALSALASRWERVRLERGEPLFRQGAPADALYLVVAGRLVAFGGGGWASASMTAGATVGELALLTGGQRSADVVAVRRSEVLKLGRADFDATCERHPRFALHVARVLAERLSRAIPADRATSVPDRVIAVIGLGDQVDLSGLCARLAASLGGPGRCLHVDEARARQALDLGAADEDVWTPEQATQLGRWLADQEEKHAFILVDAGSGRSPWQDRALAHADHVLLVARATGSSALRPIEQSLYRGDPGAWAPPVSLALVHAAGTTLPAGTSRWLAPRRLRAHYHLREGDGASTARLARLLTRQGVGVVLGGGGALGAAHIGALQALSEQGIPIDAVGGTSVGGGIGAQLAMGLDFEEIRRVCFEQFVEHNPFRGLTLPVVSLCSRSSMDRTAHAMYGEAHIEDLWLPYFCVSTSLTRHEPRVHREGPLWLAVRATTALPGIAPPVLLDGEVLVDGGLVDNLPVGPMRALCGGPLIAIDVSPETGIAAHSSYDEMPGPLGALAQRWSTRGRAGAPLLSDILVHSIMVGSQNSRERSRALADLVLRPPLERFSPTGFGDLDEMRRIAYLDTTKRLRATDLSHLTAAAPAAQLPGAP